MLFADKQALETDLKVSLLSIRERELKLYSENCRSIGAQAALLAGFTYGGVTIAGTLQESARIQFVSLHVFVTTVSMGCNIACCFGATCCSMFGPGLALRGPDGAMDQAVEGLALEFRLLFLIFIFGLILFYLSASIFICLDFEWYSAALLLILLGFFTWWTVKVCKRIYSKFKLPVEMAIAGNFDPLQPSNSRVTQSCSEKIELEKLQQQPKWRNLCRRAYLQWSIFYDEFLGISASVYEERYGSAATHGREGTSETWFNTRLHGILHYLESNKPSGGQVSPTRRRRHSLSKEASRDRHLHGSHSAGDLASASDSADGYSSFSAARDSSRARVDPSHSQRRSSQSPISSAAKSSRGVFWRMSSWKSRSSEELATLPGNMAVLEMDVLSAMAPAEHLASGAISPTDTDASSG